MRDILHKERRELTEELSMETARRVVDEDKQLSARKRFAQARKCSRACDERPVQR